MAKTPITPFRLDPDLVRWADAHAKKRGMTRTGIVRELLEALREGRIVIQDRAGPNPFPAEGEVSPGETPEYPALIAWAQPTASEE